MSALCLTDHNRVNRTGQGRAGQDKTGKDRVLDDQVLAPVYISTSTELAPNRMFHTLFCEDQKLSD